MQILADDSSRYELLTPEKTEFVLEEVEGHSMFQIPLPLEDGRPDGTVSDDTSNSSVHESERFVPVSSEDCGHFLSGNLKQKHFSTKLTVMSICSTFGQDESLR